MQSHRFSRPVVLVKTSLFFNSDSPPIITNIIIHITLQQVSSVNQLSIMADFTTTSAAASAPAAGAAKKGKKTPAAADVPRFGRVRSNLKVNPNTNSPIILILRNNYSTSIFYSG